MRHMNHMKHKIVSVLVLVMILLQAIVGQPVLVDAEDTGVNSEITEDLILEEEPLFDSEAPLVDGENAGDAWPEEGLIADSDSAENAEDIWHEDGLIADSDLAEQAGDTVYVLAGQGEKDGNSENVLAGQAEKVNNSEDLSAIDEHELGSTDDASLAPDSADSLIVDEGTNDIITEISNEEAGVFFSDEELPDQDELLEGFIEETFQISSSVAAAAPGKTSGDALSGVDSKLYSILKAFIMDVALGKRESTYIDISVADAGMGKRWTAAELGVATIDQDGDITDEAADRLFDKYEYNVSLVLRSLMADLPYDLFWYDKLQGVRWGHPSSLHAAFDNSIGEYTLQIAGSFSFAFFVCEEYVGASDFTVNRDLIASIQTARENANKIIADYEVYTDYTRLFHYMKRICELASYNKEAAESENVSYGNAWQVIWVFDGDPNTNVVCEGYAKAFQYLCDMSDFIGPVSCICASGNVQFMQSQGTSSGSHMWNVVTMEDGENYLADITNCDSGSIGSGGELFLAGYYEHPYDNMYVVSLGSKGYAAYSYDSVTQSVNSEDTLRIASHSYVAGVEEHACTNGGEHTIEVIPEVAPTPLHTGLSKGKICSECGKVFVEQETVPIPMSLCEISLAKTSMVYDGKSKEPAVTVLADETRLEAGTHYSVRYINNRNAGSASVEITGLAPYEGTVQLPFKIEKAKVSIAGRDLSVKFSKNKRTLQLPVSISPNVKHSFVSANSKIKVSAAGKITIPGLFAGVAKITATITDPNYQSVKKTVSVNVLPTTVTIKKAKRASAKTLLVKWKKNASATSYEFQVALNKAFTKGVKSRTFIKRLTQITLGGLKKGKTYYVRMRCVVRNSNGTCYSAWSKVRKIK